MASLMNQVFQAFKDAGLSENQAKIITAEVGREGSFLPKNLFGFHKDDSNNATNVGMLSWQSGREKPLLSSLSKLGLFKDGKIEQSAKTLGVMARYAVHEIRSNPAYRQTKEVFLNNPNVDYKTGSRVLGTDFIKWRYNDPEYASGHQNRDHFYKQVGGEIKGTTQPQRQSTFQRVKANFHQDQAPSIAKVYDAYKQGKMNAQQKKDFESDVRSGAIMLPEGAKLNGVKKEPILLPQSISNAYVSGQLSNKQRTDLEDDIKQGRVRLPPATKNESSLPDFDQNNIIREEPTEQAVTDIKQPPTLTDKLKGAGEAALSTATGMTTGAIGFIDGALGGLGREIDSGNFGTPEAARRIEQSASEGASNFTYAPKTEIGQQYVQKIGEVAEPLIALTPAMAELSFAGQAARGVAPIAQGEALRAGKVVQTAAQNAGQRVSNGVSTVRNAFNPNSTPNTPAPANIGAAQVSQADIRNALAQDLPYPPELTQGQLTRDPSQLKFEVETAKNPLGDPIRQRYEDQHENIQQNLDAFIDMTDARSTNMRDVGIAVDAASQKQMQAEKNKVRVAYAKADQSPEAQAIVDLSQPLANPQNSIANVIEYLNSQPDLPTTPIIGAAKQMATKLGVATKGSNGELVPARPTVRQMETWRSEINGNVNHEAPNIRQATILKSLIDSHVEPVAGPLYKAARLERKRVAERWENATIMRDLTQKKKGTDDRRVALEDIQKRIIHDSSLDDLRVAKRVLLTSGDDGKQAWRDIQGSTLQEIKNAATSGVAPDARGNQMISPAALNKAIKRLDDAGKLDFVFGKQGAEKLRALNDVSKTLFTVPASSAINHSNTAATLMAAMDIALSATSGFPAPVASALRIATKHIKDNKIKKRVQAALHPNQTGNP